MLTQLTKRVVNFDVHRLITLYIHTCHACSSVMFVSALFVLKDEM